MKKINLLVIALLFTMTAKADSSTVTTPPTASSILQEVCKARKTFNTCVENSTNPNNIKICAAAYDHYVAKDLSKKYNIDYTEAIDFEIGKTKGLFSYNITFDSVSNIDYYYYEIQIESSCNKAYDSKVSKSSHFKYLKTCITSTNHTMSKLQNCN
ncbi:MAG: hypothetical protein ACR2M7_04470 [Bdellovibrionales bacterium]